MARYGLIWLEIAYADYTSLPEHTRAQISGRIEQLLENRPNPAMATTSSPTSGPPPTAAAAAD